MQHFVIFWKGKKIIKITIGTHFGVDIYNMWVQHEAITYIGGPITAEQDFLK